MKVRIPVFPMAVAIALLAGSPAIAAEQAELALRWIPRSGETLEGTATLLKLKGPLEPGSYQVGYYDFGAPPPLAPSQTAIGRVRVRTADQRREVTFKLRAEAPAGGAGHCPWPEGKPKNEVDLSLQPAGGYQARYSRSCEVKGAQEFPAHLQAQPKPCMNTMRRLTSEAQKVKVEEWLLADGSRMIEVSMEGQDTTASRDRFRALVAPLLAKSVVPSDRSKTEAGSQCP